MKKAQGQESMKRTRGFTLIEMMIVVAILGILASIAIPAFNKYVRRAKTTEGIMNLRKLFDGSVAYFERDNSDRFGRTISTQFPGGGVVLFGPGGNQNPCCDAGAQTTKCSANPAAWGHPVWQSLNFAVDDPHYFWYSYVSANTGVDSQFTAGAHANLNCAGPYSTFERVGAVSPEGNVMGGAGIFSVRPLE